MSTHHRILVDLDDTVAELMWHWDTRQLEWPELDGAPLYHQRNSWDIKAGLTAKQSQIIDNIWAQPDLFRVLQPTAGAQEAIAHLIEQGHEVWFVSTPHPLNHECASEKYAWVKRHYGEEMSTHLILSFDKTLVTGDILIDDRPTITGVAQPSWRRIIYDRPWNQNVEGVRMKSWEPAEVSQAIWGALVSA